MNATGTDVKGNPSRSDDGDFTAAAIRGLAEEFAISPGAVESIKILSLNVEYLTLSVDVIVVIKIDLTAEEIRQNWILEAWDRDEASKFALLSCELTPVLHNLFLRHL